MSADEEHNGNYVAHRTYRCSKQVDISGMGGIIAISLTKPVCAPPAISYRVICLQDHSMLRQEEVRVCEQFRV
jgi:hypothetical protein